MREAASPLLPPTVHQEAHQAKAQDEEGCDQVFSGCMFGFLFPGNRHARDSGLQR
jgi:hypothetical protein